WKFPYIRSGFDLRREKLTGVQSACEHVFDNGFGMVLAVVEDFVEAVGLNPELYAIIRPSSRKREARDGRLHEVPAMDDSCHGRPSQKISFKANWMSRGV